MADVTAPRQLDGRGVLIVGASSGIGRAVVVAAATAGASVIAAARRFDLLQQLGEEVGPAVHPVQCDVRSSISSEAAVTAAAAHLGRIDVVLFATGVNHLAMLEDTDRDAWQQVLETNVVGASLVTRAVLPHLRRAVGRADGAQPRVGYLSSHSVARPWPGLGAYVASKAALDSMARSWRAECREVAFTRIVVGPTITGMADGWDPAVAERMFTVWADEGYFDADEPVEADVVAQAVVAWMTTEPLPDDLDLA